jgi:hypothetical protein
LIFIPADRPAIMLLAGRQCGFIDRAAIQSRVLTSLW